MARELNRELFGGARGREMDPQAQTPAAPSFAKADDVRVLHLHVESVSKRLKEFESRVESLNTKVEDMVNQNKQRFERVQGHFQRQNDILQSGFKDVHAKMAQVVSRVNERKVEEGMIKEMVERHASVVQSFEVRMQQLQRVISEQELQLMNARAELKDALHEITRLKKL
jgi:hypothetical protein